MELGTPDNVLFKFSIFVIIWLHILVSEMGEKWQRRCYICIKCIHEFAVLRSFVCSFCQCCKV